MKKNILITLVLLFAGAWFTTSCSDMMNIDSNRVIFSDDYKLNNANDTVYGTLGILKKLQKVADRTVLLGELRGDLLSTNSATETNLSNIANFNFTATNPYLSVKDYYAIINNCNYFINKVDTTVSRSGKKLMLKEYVAAKTVRAWTYLQLGINYGFDKVPFIDKPILTVADAEISKYPAKSLSDMANYFIKDLLPYIDSDQYPLPSWTGFTVGGNSMFGKLLFIPVPLILGDWFLWSGNYESAALCYYEQFDKGHYTDHTYVNSFNDEKGMSMHTSNNTIFTNCYTDAKNNQETLTIIPMEYSSQNGMVSGLSDIFRPNVVANHQLDASYGWKNLSLNQAYIYRDKTAATPVTYVVSSENMPGDLRIYGITSNFTVDGTPYNKVITKFSVNATETSTTTDANGNNQTVVTSITDDGGNTLLYTPYVILYRSAGLYLKLAEAINGMARQGYSGAASMAFDILKSGIKNKIYTVALNGDTVHFDFTNGAYDDNVGIHSRGCGQVEFNTVDYALDKKVIAAYYGVDTTQVVVEGDTLGTIKPQYLCNFVDDKILDEYALEMPVEGGRFGDLMRFAMRRADNNVLARRVAGRGTDNGANNCYSADFKFDNALYTKLMNESNWYLPLK